MALYTRDYEYEHGEQALKTLRGEEGDLIRYYVSEEVRFRKIAEEQNRELMEVFAMIRKFTRD